MPERAFRDETYVVMVLIYLANQRWRTAAERSEQRRSQSDQAGMPVSGGVECPASTLPWVKNPYGLISWWEMQKFFAVDLFTIGSMIERLKSGHEITALRPRGNAPIDRREADTLLAGIEYTIGIIGLKLSNKKVKDTIKALNEQPPISDADLSAAFDDIYSRINDEMLENLFMHVPSERAAYYNKPELFGKDVNSRFPNVQFDIVEAGNCYAAGRGTACVFHLMRLMELAVQEFGNKLGVTLTDEKVWQVILDGINKEIKALPQKDPHTVALSEASANLYSVKLAWRNEVMHPKETYTLEEALNIIRQVEIFVKQW